MDLTVESPALGRTAKVRLLTPDGWEQRRSGDRWPVLYLLHGCCDTYESWTLQTDVEELAQLRDVLVVMPEAGPAGWYSDWWNHGAGGPPAWETFHTRELRRVLEHDYGAGQKRVIAGLSMGGFGALSYAARNPGMFRLLRTGCARLAVLGARVASLAPAPALRSGQRRPLRARGLGAAAWARMVRR
jgi:S-formylglutathione hydrolase FrmB